MKVLAHKCYMEVKIQKLEQGDKKIWEYCGELFQLCDELTIFEHKRCDTYDIVLREKQFQEDKFYKFVVGIRPEFDIAETSLLHRPSLPTLNEALVELVMEE